MFGGPEPVHDVDFVVAEPDTEKAAATLEAAGFTIERTPEDWLFKACVGSDFVIDVLHRLNGVPVDAGTILSAEELDVLAIRMRVLPPTYVLTEKLNSLNEHHCDFASLVPAVRAVREQLDWHRLAPRPPTTTSLWRFWCSPTGWASLLNGGQTQSVLFSRRAGAFYVFSRGEVARRSRSATTSAVRTTSGGSRTSKSQPTVAK